MPPPCAVLFAHVRISIVPVSSAPLILSGTAAAGVLLTCEHASAGVPAEYADLGLCEADLRDHIGWDIGAATVTVELSHQLAAPAVLSPVSRLLVDCNRSLEDHDLIPAMSHGVVIPGNLDLTAAERRRRLARFYEPYHAAVDAALARYPGALLLSIHSFTPSLNGAERPFEVGVLFDDFEDEAHALAARVAAVGFGVRMNEPYSGFDGLIYSARRHGRRHGVRYLELEINNRLLREEQGARAVAARLVSAIVPLAARATPVRPQPQGGSRCVSS